MQARILFLGTAGDMFAAAKQTRYSGGIIINVDETQLHIDPGPGSLIMARSMGVNLRENTAVLVTGNELVRANDINSVISSMTQDGLDKKGVLVCPSSLLNPGSEKDAFLNRPYNTFIEKTILTDTSKKMGINNVDIEVIELKGNTNEECGYKIITERFSIAYIPDTAFSNDLAEQLAGVDIIILSVLDSRGNKRKEHLNSEDAEKIIKKVSPQLSIITGFGLKMIESDPLYEAREMQKSIGIQVISAKDGMNINPMSFAATVRQKSLSGF
jgi:ribonuclease BN (tRNA processing enzyme)